MRYVAFKRAKSSDKVKKTLHDEFITEYAYTDLFPEGFHKPEDGYEILPEDEFQEELAKNEERHEESLAKKKELEKAKLEARKAADKKKQEEIKKEKQEYKEFLRWKQSRGK